MPPPPSSRSSGSQASKSRSSAASVSAPVSRGVGGSNRGGANTGPRSSGPPSRGTRPATSGQGADKKNIQSSAVRDAEKIARESAALREDAKRSGIRSINIGPAQQPVEIGSGRISQSLTPRSAPSGLTAPLSKNLGKLRGTTFGVGPMQYPVTTRVDGSLRSGKPTYKTTSNFQNEDTFDVPAYDYPDYDRDMDAPYFAKMGRPSEEYLDFSKVDVASLPSVKLSGQILPTSQLALDRNLVSKYESDLRGPRYLGSFDSGTGVLTINPSNFGPQAIYERNSAPVGQIFSHEAGHAATRALTSSPESSGSFLSPKLSASYENLRNLDRNVYSMIGTGNPSLMTGKGTVGNAASGGYNDTGYSSYPGNELMSRLDDLSYAYNAGDWRSGGYYGAAASAERALQSIAPDIYGGTRYTTTAVGNYVTTPEKPDPQKIAYMKELHDQRNREALRLSASGQPTAYEIARGIKEIPSEGISGIYKGWSSKPYYDRSAAEEAYRNYIEEQGRKKIMARERSIRLGGGKYGRP